MTTRPIDLSHRRHSHSRAHAILILIFTTLSACVHRETTTVEVTSNPMQTTQLRGATNLPARFLVVTPAGAQGDCPPRLRDPEVDVTLRLVRSVLRQSPDTAVHGYSAIGDYVVEPRGLYGDRAGEGVRVDCARLGAIGIVRLQPAPPDTTATGAVS